MVREKINNRSVINQPAGHWEQGETLVEAAIRETLEETAYDFEPQGVVGIYDWTVPENPDLTFLRICIFGEVTRHYPERKLDDGIETAQWIGLDELHLCGDELRSPMVLNCFLDYLDGKRYPLDIIQHVAAGDALQRY